MSLRYSILFCNVLSWVFAHFHFISYLAYSFSTLAKILSPVLGQLATEFFSNRQIHEQLHWIKLKDVHC